MTHCVSVVVVEGHLFESSWLAGQPDTRASGAQQSDWLLREFLFLEQQVKLCRPDDAKEDDDDDDDHDQASGRAEFVSENSEVARREWLLIYT